MNTPALLCLLLILWLIYKSPAVFSSLEAPVFRKTLLLLGTGYEPGHAPYLVVLLATSYSKRMY